MRKNNIVPIDVSSSREYYGLNNSTDVYKGTSFKFSGEWASNVHYFNDEYIIDFVAYDGSLWACQRNHLSTESTKPSTSSRFWTEVITGVEGRAYVPSVVDGQLIFSLESNPPSEPIDIGSLIGPSGKDGVDGKDGKNGKDGIDGKDGKNGLTYRPDPTLEGNYIVFRTEEGDVVRVDCSQFKGEKGDKGNDWIFSKAVVTSIEPDATAAVEIVADKPGHSDTTYTLKLWIPRGKDGARGLQGKPGMKGNTGDPGPGSEFKIDFDKKTGLSILYSRWVATPESEWKYVGPVGGTPGKSPKLIRVLSTVDDPDKQDSTRRNDRILWGYDGVPVSEWTTLCYLDDLRGDENIWVGCDEPKMLDGETPDYDKIWYDPCDEAVDKFSTVDFIYQSYLDSGGNLPKDEFIEAFSSINKTSGFEIKFVKSFEDLGEPNEEKANILWLVPSSTSEPNNKYIEYIALYNQSTEEYTWEQWGSQDMTINLEDYYTKDEVDTLLQDISSTIWIPL